MIEEKKRYEGKKESFKMAAEISWLINTPIISAKISICFCFFEKENIRKFFDFFPQNSSYSIQIK